jgi:hypothetical protein
MSGVGHTRWLRILFGLSISKCEMDHISLLILCPEVAPRRDEGVIGHDPKSGGDRMSHLGQSRRSDRGPATSGLARSTDIVRPTRHVAKVPTTDIAASVTSPPPSQGPAASQPSSLIALPLGNRHQWQPGQTAAAACGVFFALVHTAVVEHRPGGNLRWAT